jgi:hypothetical protein
MTGTFSGQFESGTFLGQHLDRYVLSGPEDTCPCTVDLKESTALVKMSLWDEKRANMIKDMVGIKGLRSNIRTMQLVKLSGYVMRDEIGERSTTANGIL